MASWHIMLGVPPKNDNKKKGEVIGLLRIIILKKQIGSSGQS